MDGAGHNRPRHVRAATPKTAHLSAHVLPVKAGHDGDSARRDCRKPLVQTRITLGRAELAVVGKANAVGGVHEFGV